MDNIKHGDLVTFKYDGESHKGIALNTGGNCLSITCDALCESVRVYIPFDDSHVSNVKKDFMYSKENTFPDDVVRVDDELHIVERIKGHGVELAMGSGSRWINFTTISENLSMFDRMMTGLDAI